MLIYEKANSLEDLIKCCPRNQIIGDNLIRAWSIINSSKYKKIVCTVSGGSDSDVMLDIVWRCDINNKVTYVWFDTGLEYQATKDHLKYLEDKYKIEIQKVKAKKPIPVSCKEYGQPFISKYVSSMIQRLQRHDFTWEDDLFENLYKKYPKCKAALSWWCNHYENNGEHKSRFNISYNKYLKEFMVQNPPTFLISAKCCDGAKKNVVHNLIRKENYDLNIYGVRKAEGGTRATSYKSCFDDTEECDNYRPLFWYRDADKQEYEIHFDVIHSDCYRIYEMKRTGCAGCPYNRKFEDELNIIFKYEPKLYKAVNHIFGESYKYTRQYHDFCRKMKENDKESKRI